MVAQVPAPQKHMVALGVFPPKFTGQKDRSLSLFVIDGKGVLWEDAVALAKDRGWKYRVIGIEDGEWGLDLCDGQEPESIIAAIEEGSAQMSGGGGKESNPIFRKMGLQIFRACLKLARVYELTDEGFELVKANRERIYSLSYAYTMSQSVLEPGGLLFKIVDAITRNAADAKKAVNIAPLLTPDLFADIAFLRSSLLKSYPHDTVGSFLVNITEMLSPFVTNVAVRSRFGAARGSQMEIDDLWEDKVVTCFRLSPTTAVGSTARLIGILTMIRLFGRASVRQLIQKDVGKYAKLGIVMDEAQELITSGIWGLSATTAWTRSAGLSVAVATQGLDGLIDRIGEAATLTLMNNLRTKVFLQTEAKRDQDFVISLGAEVYRSMVHDGAEFESWHARLMQKNDGVMDDRVRPFPADEVDYTVTAEDLLRPAFGVGPLLQEPVKLARGMMNDLKDLIYSSIDYKPQVGKSLADAFTDGAVNARAAARADAQRELEVIREEQRALDRQEDKTRMFFGGWEKQSLWTRGDVSKLGMGQAIVFINRAGVLRTDKIDVNPDLAKPLAQRMPAIDVQARVVKPAGVEFAAATPAPALANADVAKLAQTAADAVLARRAQAATMVKTPA